VPAERKWGVGGDREGKMGVAGSDYETISGNLDTSFRIQRNHSAIQQRRKNETENI
jgi:hypothetical protein